MRVFVTGATGVLGGFAVPALLADGHEVAGLARAPEKAQALESAGAEPVSVHLFDAAALADAFRGFDAVCNLATHIPVGMAGLRPGAWRLNDRLRTEGSRAVATAAKQAGVRRLVQESGSFIYADGGDEWITEDSPLAVTRSVESSAVAETNAAKFACKSRESVTLRFGSLIGDDPITRWMLGRARAGRPVGLGAVDSWTHLVHPADAASGIVAAMHAPGGVYNAGADPVRRGDVLQVVGDMVERAQVSNLSRLFVRLAGERAEPMTRSHRVSSGKLHEVTGWKPAHPVFEQSWLPVTSP